MELEVKIASGEIYTPEAIAKFGRPSELTCPECNGVLWELNERELLRFRCRVGHAYTAVSLQVAHSEAEEASLWNAFRIMEESAVLARRIARFERGHNQADAAVHFEVAAQSKDQKAKAIQQLLLRNKL